MRRRHSECLLSELLQIVIQDWGVGFGVAVCRVVRKQLFAFRLH